MKHLLIYSASRSEFGIWQYFLRRLIERGFTVTFYCSRLLEKSNVIDLEIDPLLSSGRFNLQLGPDTIENNDLNRPLSIIPKEMAAFAEFIANTNIDGIVLLGDRFEIFSIAIPAYYGKIPIMHLHGGEKTVGSLDDSARHSISKLANFHFTCHDIYSKRLRQIGEDPRYIFNVGSISIDRLNYEVASGNIENARNELPQITSPYALVAFNPVSNENNQCNRDYIENLIAVVKDFPGITFIFTTANEDEQSIFINESVNAACNTNSNIVYAGNMGYLRFYAALSGAIMFIGNSSAGIIDAPFLKIPTINIGTRQDGRVKASSIIDVGYATSEISMGINMVLRSKPEGHSEFGYGGASDKIIDILNTLDYSSNRIKCFIDYE